MNWQLWQLSALQARTAWKLANLKAKLSAAMESSGHIVDDVTHVDLMTIAEQYSSIVASCHLSGSFPHVFWEHQLEAAWQKDSRGIRWHPLIIKWATCIYMYMYMYLHYCSSSAYNTLHSSGLIALPTQRDYTHHFGGPLWMWISSFKTTLCPWCRGVEMTRDFAPWRDVHQRGLGLQHKHRGLGGFCKPRWHHRSPCTVWASLGETWNQPCLPTLAKTMLAIMVRRVCIKLCLPYAQFTCVNLTYPLFWEVVFWVERCELKVVGATFDGASPNRHFLLLHQWLHCPEPTTSLVYKVKNPYTRKEWDIFFFSDPPHLMKTVRNCWASKARQLGRWWWISNQNFILVQQLCECVW